MDKLVGSTWFRLLSLFPLEFMWPHLVSLGFTWIHLVSVVRVWFLLVSHGFQFDVASPGAKSENGKRLRQRFGAWSSLCIPTARARQKRVPGWTHPSPPLHTYTHMYITYIYIYIHIRFSVYQQCCQTLRSLESTARLSSETIAYGKKSNAKLLSEKWPVVCSLAHEGGGCSNYPAFGNNLHVF
jgi:hypothetical protein